jgi:NitT/TauT family transport system substrate-binding protein
MTDAIQLAGEGRQVRGFLLLYTRPSAALAIAPSMLGTIRSVRDLKGRTVGVTSPGSSSHQILNYLLRSSGISPEEVSTVSVGMSASSLAALEHGTVAAAVILGTAIPAFEQRHPHDALLVDLRTPEGARQVFGSDVFPALGLVAEDRWLRDNGETARHLVAAVTRGMQWVREHPAEQVHDIIPESSRMSTEVDLLAIRQMQQVLSRDGRIPEDAVPLIQRFVAASNPAVASSHIDFARLFSNEFASSR